MAEAERAGRSPERVQSLDRTFSLLEQLADGPLTLSELAEATSLPMPTVHRLLRFLTSQGYARQERSKRYALGLRMIRLGQSASRGLGPWITPYLTRLVDLFGETANMALLEGDACVYVAQVPSPQSMRMFTEVGRAVSAHCTAVGKAILADEDAGAVRALLARTGMEARTEHTITEPEALLRALEQVRAQGYAMDDQEQELGVRCVAVAVPDAPSRIAMSVSGPAPRMTEQLIGRAVSLLTEAAAALAKDLASGHHERSR
jgi:IclR family transcriptional regulator, acetate operon repressor